MKAPRAAMVVRCCFSRIFTLNSNITQQKGISLLKPFNILCTQLHIQSWIICTQTHAGVL